MTETPFHLRPAEAARDADAVWRMIGPVLAAGETYALPRDWDRDTALAYWFMPAHEVWIAEAEGAALGTYFMQANQQGGGAHVANCGFVTDGAATGRGIARRMCQHALAHARARGFRAMQFNFVVSSNARAVALWASLGFETVGRLPAAFEHPRLGEVDALVMYRRL